MKWVMRVLRWLFGSEPISKDIREARREQGSDFINETGRDVWPN